jgi:hypothetical protein
MGMTTTACGTACPIASVHQDSRMDSDYMAGKCATMILADRPAANMLKPSLLHALGCIGTALCRSKQYASTARVLR